MAHQMYHIISNLLHIDVNVISLTNHSTTPTPDPIQNIHTSFAISYSFQSNSLQKFPNLETSLGTPSRVLPISGCSSSPPILGAEVSLCHCGSWYPIFFLNSCHCSLWFTIDSTLLPKLSSGKKINLVLSVCFKTSLDFVLPTE